MKNLIAAGLVSFVALQATAGTVTNGLPLYSFRYIGLPQVYSGVMAQDVLMHSPEAVVAGPFGYMMVDYGMLGLEMQRLN